MPLGIHFNPAAFKKNFVLNRAKSSGQIEAFVSLLGPDRISWLIQQARDLEGLAPSQLVAEYRARGQGYGWVSNILTDADMKGLLPPWAIELVRQEGDKGEEWLSRQLLWIRGFLTGAS